MWIKLLLKKEDVQIAINMLDSVLITHYCPIFQALKRQGLKPRQCQYHWAELDNRSRVILSERARKITNLNKHNWYSLLEKLEKKPMEFSIRAVRK